MSNLAPTCVEPPAAWRKAVAAALDFVSVLFVAGFAIATLTGNLTKSGFELNGAPALVVFAGIAVYFVVFTRFLGGTVWQRVLGVR
jgi:hypothetical protein